MLAAIDAAGWVIIIGAAGVVLANIVAAVGTIIVQVRTHAELVKNTAQTERVATVVTDTAAVSEQLMGDIAAGVAKTEKAVNGQSEALRQHAYAAGGRDKVAEQEGTPKEGLPDMQGKGAT